MLSLAFRETIDAFTFAEEKQNPDFLRAVPGAPPAFEVRRTADGFLVRLPMAAPCSCIHHVMRVPFHVSTSGCITRPAEPLVPLAWASEICLD
jgi:hypothetical protein